MRAIGRADRGSHADRIREARRSPAGSLPCVTRPLRFDHGGREGCRRAPPSREPAPAARSRRRLVRPQRDHAPRRHTHLEKASRLRRDEALPSARDRSHANHHGQSASAHAAPLRSTPSRSCESSGCSRWRRLVGRPDAQTAVRPGLLPRYSAGHPWILQNGQRQMSSPHAVKGATASLAAPNGGRPQTCAQAEKQHAAIVGPLPCDRGLTRRGIIAIA